MDCPSEERIIRLKLEDHAEIQNLDFNIPGRELTVIHLGDANKLLNDLVPLNFGASIKSSFDIITNGPEISTPGNKDEWKLLIMLLLINGGMFFIEFSFGIFAESMGLISDSLDMLADAGVYGISLYAVGKALTVKKKSALINGLFQFVLGFGVIFETVRRFIYGSDPEPAYMIFVSLMALAANVYCLALLSKHKDGEVHMQASYICSSTDVMANVGIVLAGVAVFLTKSPYPDLVIGMIVTVIVLRGAITILKLVK
ncbi:MAG: cation diffusion facilitator family transporter [Bacteriovoracaceae bacterium]|nr:cation diffusion facilitator family transporter [Bacteriovoracaceae bacterium]